MPDMRSSIALTDGGGDAELKIENERLRTTLMILNQKMKILFACKKLANLISRSKKKDLPFSNVHGLLKSEMTCCTKD